MASDNKSSEEPANPKVKEVLKDYEKEGWLDKKAWFFPVWYRRYFHLKGQNVNYYSDETKKNKSGSFEVDRCTAKEVKTKSSSGKIYGIEITTRKFNTIKLRTDDEKQRYQWVDIIQKAADQTGELLKIYAQEDECINCIAVTTAEEAEEEVEEVPEGKEEENKGKLYSLPIQNTEGKESPLGSIFTEGTSTAVVALLRHFG